MKQYYCLDVSFPNVWLDQYLTFVDSISPKHHAHLFIHDNEIELRIFHKTGTYLGRKLGTWLTKINWKDFGSYLSSEGETQNESLKKIDFNNSGLLKLTTGTDQTEGDHEYVQLWLDSVKFYWTPADEKLNTAEFYLNDTGFRLVQEYYNPLSEKEDSFMFEKQKELEGNYSISNGSFRPEFHFWRKDKRDSREAVIVKEPKIQFQFDKDVTENEISIQSETIKLLASFYYSAPIDYVFSRIHLKEHTITTKKIKTESKSDHAGNLFAFGSHLHFHNLLKTNWEVNANANFKKLQKSVELFLQSLSVDNSSRFLIRYNIIEICMSGTKITSEKFNPILDKKEVLKKYKEALDILLETISPEDHEAFTKKWDGVPGKLTYKPMKSPLTTFLINQGLEPDKFPISINDLKEIRDSITHGSLEKVANRDLERANILLYRISGILILNLIGIKDWRLNTDIPN